GLRLALGLEALEFALQPRSFALGLVDLGEQAPRVVGAANQQQAAEDHRQQQHEVELRHGASVRSATRRMAERARGLAATSSAEGLMRPSASSRIALGGANGARRSTTSRLSRAMKVLTMRSSSEWKLITAR